MLTILHGSDLHFGKPFNEKVAGVFRSSIRALAPDLIVLSGDFTQRAKIEEYRRAREFLKDLSDFPVVVTPGNHDVPLYRVWERLFTPLRNYRRFVSREVDTVTSIPGATVVSLNSTAPRRAIVNGRIDDAQLLFAAGSFDRAPAGNTRVVVLHHHLAPAPDYESDQVLPGFRRCLEAFQKMKVELILGGHLHRAYVAYSMDLYPGAATGPGILIAHSGTTTSKRGRARERNKNTFNLIGIAGDHFLISHYRYVEGSGEFAPFRSHHLPRGIEGVLGCDPVRGGSLSSPPAQKDEKENS